MLGTAPINPFMSFTSLKESMGVDEQMADSHLDPNFQVVLKKMNKKDGVTKLKVGIILSTFSLILIILPGHIVVFTLCQHKSYGDFYILFNSTR